MTPLALRMLIEACTSGDGIHATPHLTNEPQTQILVWFGQQGIVDHKGMATAKGRAWLDLILETPMPIQRWIDPRDGGVNIGEYTRSQDDYASLYPAPPPPKHEFVDPRPAVAESTLAVLNPTPEQKAAAYAATVPKPPEGFTHHVGQAWTHTDNEGNQRAVFMPQGLNPGDDVEVWYRDGIAEKRYPDKQITDKDGKPKTMQGKARPAGGPAASINWQHRGGDDDVIGWRKLDQPAVIKMVMPKK